MSSRDPNWKPSVPNPFDPTAFSSPIYGDQSEGSSSHSLDLAIGGGNQDISSIPNPFDVVPDYRRRNQAGSVMSAFLPGVGSGFLHPIRQLTGRGPEVEPPDGWTTGHTIAGFAGELTGMIGSFIPFLKGTQVGLKAVGLGARTAQGAFLRTPGFALAEGTISGALFEIGSDWQDDILTRVAVGAGTGAAAEVILLGAGAAWRGKWRTNTEPAIGTSTSTALVRLEDTPQGVRRSAQRAPVYTDVNPGALAMERAMHPEGGKSFQEAVDRLRAIESHPEQLAHAAARVALHYQPFGMAILTGIDQPGQVLRALRKQVGWEDVGLHLRSVGNEPLPVARIAGEAWDRTADNKPMWEILMFDKRARDRLQLAGKSEQEIIDVFMAEGSPKKLDEMLAIIRAPGVEPPVNVITHPTIDAVSAAYGHGTGQTVGFASPYTGTIQTLGDSSQEALSTLVHEYAHFFTFWASQRSGGSLVSNQTVRATLFDSDNIYTAQKAKAAGFADAASFVTRVEEELNAATLEILSHNNNLTLKSAKKIFDGSPQYYQRDNERISRLAELMLIDPKKARKVAPHAVDLFADQIERHSPKMRSLLSKQELRNVHQILEGLWRKGVNTGETSLFARLPEVNPGPNQIQQWERAGVFYGMSVQHQGSEWVVRNLGVPNKAGRIRLQNPMTGVTKSVHIQDITRPTMRNLVERTEDVIKKVQGLTKTEPDWLGVVIRQAPELDEVATAAHPKKRKIERWAVRRAIVSLVKMDRVDNMAQYLGRNKDIHERVLRQFQEETGMTGKIVRDELRDNWNKLTPEERATNLQDPNVREALLRDLTPDDVLREISLLKGTDGVVFNDNGRYLIYVAKQEALAMADNNVISHRWAKSIDGNHDSPWITPSQENVMESLLREAGVSERELDYFMQVIPFAPYVREVAEQEGLLSRIMEGIREASNIPAGAVEGSSAAVNENIEIAARRSGFRVDRTTDGELRLLSDTNETVASSMDEAALHEYLAKVGPDTSMPNLESELPIQSTALPQANTAVRPIRPFEQPPMDRPKEGFSQRFLDSTQLFLASWTALENVAKSAERQGLGPVFTKIFHPIQEALVRVDNQLAGIKRDALGGRTFSEQLKLVERLTEGLLFGKSNKQRQALYVQAMEAMSREEIARPGGLLQRGLSQAEIGLAQAFEVLGVQHDIPRLTGVLRMAKQSVKNKEQFPRKLADMQRVEVSPEFRQNLEQLAQMLDDMPDTVEGVLRELGLSQQQLTAVGMIDEILRKGVDDQSLFAISRYATAKPLAPGYKTARDQMMDVNGFTSKERQAIEEMERLYKAAFEVSKLHHKKEIGGYWPHMKKWIENGTMPEEDFIRKYLPESVEWSAERVRTGELDIYLTDPTLTSAKYVRSMLMKQEFDPILPDVKKAVSRMRARDPRMHAIFSEYVHEATGRPHASFRKLHDMISRSSQILTGRTPDPRFTRDLVNNIGGLANAAAIPFRPMLIARNYFQMTQMIPARTGVNEFFDGLRIAMTDEGFKEAVEKNIVTKNVLPVHASTEVYGYDASAFNRRIKRIFEKGFAWYQKPDDIGRAAAFFAAKARIAKHSGDEISGKITFEQFKSRAKINTYDSIDIQEFDKLWKAGRYEEATDYMGSRLARETIFRYGHANHPAGWGSVPGRLFGTFGTWPTQYKDFLLQGMTRGSTRDRAEFLAIHSAVNAATLAAGAAAGIDLMSWISFPALNYTGGPVADLAVNMIQSMSGSPQEQKLANRNIRGMFPSLEDPSSIFIPGSFFVGDMYKALTAADAGEGVMNALAIREVRKGGSNPFAGIWD